MKHKNLSLALICALSIFAHNQLFTSAFDDTVILRKKLDTQTQTLIDNRLQQVESLKWRTINHNYEKKDIPNCSKIEISSMAIKKSEKPKRGSRPKPYIMIFYKERQPREFTHNAKLTMDREWVKKASDQEFGDIVWNALFLYDQSIKQNLQH